MYSHNFNNLLGKSYDNYTNKFLQTTPPSHHPYVLLVHIPVTLSSAIVTGTSVALESKKQPQITANSMTLLLSLALAEERKGEKHEGTIMGSVQVHYQKPSLSFKSRVLDMFLADKSSLAWRTGRTILQTPPCSNF